MGTNHDFVVVENGEAARYILTTKLTNGMQVLVDLRRNGEMVVENKIVPMGGQSRQPENKYIKQGIALLMDYEPQEALKVFNLAMDLSPNDAEIYFHMACCYSLLEDVTQSYECLKKSVECGLREKENIFNHEMLAFARIHPAFEDFVNSDFTYFNVDDHPGDDEDRSGKSRG